MDVFRRFRRTLAVLALVAIASGLAGCPDRDLTIPDKTVVLTFDDNLRCHLTYVAPLLKEYGFNATFFITGAWMHLTESHLSFEEIVPLREMGFEIGNHSFGHYGYYVPDKRREMVEDLDKVDLGLTGAGMEKPTSFAWPGGAFGPEARKLLLARGIRFARRGSRPEVPTGVIAQGPLYDPQKHDQLLIPTTLIVRAQTTVADLKQAIAGAHDGKAAIIQFHGVPDPYNPAVSTDPQKFREFLDVLRDEGCNIISLGDLEQWVKPGDHPDDDLAETRVP